MPQKKHKPEEIIAKLRQVGVSVPQGQSVGEAVRSIGVTQNTYYRWGKEYGGLKTDRLRPVVACIETEYLVCHVEFEIRRRRSIQT